MTAQTQPTQSQPLHSPLLDYAAARLAMVQSQIHPSGVVTEAVLDAYKSVPRELFVPAAKAGVCYKDEDLSVGRGRYLMEPMTHARMVEMADIKPDQTVLDVGGGSGYSAAILARLAKNVVALESDSESLRMAEQAWAKIGINNLIGIYGPLAEGCLKHAPYDVIIVNGAVSAIPAQLMQQLSPNGVLLCVLQEPNMAGAVVVAKKINENVEITPLFSAATPYLKEFAPTEDFKF